MLKRLFKSAAPNPAAWAKAPAGERIYAIGDVHGRLDKLEALWDLIQADRAGFSGRARAVFLGDYVDRGPHSAQVIGWLLARAAEGEEIICLRGNHEQAFMDVAGGDTRWASSWLQYGGRETLQSYGLPSRLAFGDDVEAIASALGQALPGVHREWLNSLGLTHRFGDYLFVHAGVRPGKPLEAQAPEDLMWIREPFLSSDEDHGALVVHGHTVTSSIHIGRNRIGLDTGAYATGRLSAAAIDEGGVRFLATRGDS